MLSHPLSQTPCLQQMYCRDVKISGRLLRYSDATSSVRHLFQKNKFSLWTLESNTDRIVHLEYSSKNCLSIGKLLFCIRTERSTDRCDAASATVTYYLSATLHNNTMSRLAVHVNKRVAVALWKLATNTDYMSITQLFGVGISVYTLRMLHRNCSTLFREHFSCVKKYFITCL